MLPRATAAFASAVPPGHSPAGKRSTQNSLPSGSASTNHPVRSGLSRSSTRVIAQRIDELADHLAGDPPGEGYLAKVARLTAAREHAKGRVLGEYFLLPPDEDRPVVVDRGHPSWAEVVHHAAQGRLTDEPACLMTMPRHLATPGHRPRPAVLNPPGLRATGSLVSRPARPLLRLWRGSAP